MRLAAIILLGLGAAALMAYPLWGLLSPETYAHELKAHYAYGEGASDMQIRKSAAMVWAPNGLLASAFVCLAAFTATPRRTAHARWAGACLIAYPFVRTLVEALSGLNLTLHVEGVEVAAQFSSEKLVYIAFGVALLGIASARPLDPDNPGFQSR